MVEKVKTGIKGLDDALGGGFPKGASVLLTTDAPEKTGFLCLDWIYRGLKTGEPSIFITTETSPEEIKISSVERGQSFVRFEKDLLRWIDVYSLDSGLSPDENPAVNRVSSHLSLYDITVSASLFQSEFYRRSSGHRLVLQFIDSLIVKNNSQTFMRFLKVLDEKTRKAEGNSIYVMKKGFYEYLLDDLLKLVDVRLDVFQTDEGTVMEVLKFPESLPKTRFGVKVGRTSVEIG